MKIILAAKSVYPFHPVGGVQKYVYYFARHLVKAGVKVHVVAPLDTGKPRTEEIDGVGFSLIPPRIAPYLELPVGWLGVHAFSRALAKFLKTQEFDILHAFDMTGLYYACLVKRKPVIAHIFSDNYLCNPIGLTHYLSLFGFMPADIKKTKIAMSPWADWKTVAFYPAQYFGKVKPMWECLSRCDFAVFEDEYFRKEACALYRLPAEKTGVLPVGVDAEFLRWSMGRSRLTRDSLGLKADDLVLLTVNRLAADKGIDKIILALKIIRQGIPNAKLLIVGKGYQEKELLSLIASNGLGEHVRLVKDVREEDLYGHYKISDLYLCAFSFPGSSISTVEAMACGLPVVTTAQPWLIAGNGVFIPDNGPAAIAGAVLGLAGADLKAQGAISRKIVEEYDWPRIVQTSLRQYKNLPHTVLF